MRIEGEIASWNDRKGYGFITPVGGGKQLFVHITAFGDRRFRPEPGQKLTYAISTDSHGRPCAKQARLTGARLQVGGKRWQGSLAFVATILYVAMVGGAVVFTGIPVSVFALYIGASLVTFIVYAADKSAARAGAWRTPESTLHLLALAGGWPGAVAAQHMLRHKSSKRAFLILFRLTVFLNCVFFIWLFTPTGSAALRSLLSGWA